MQIVTMRVGLIALWADNNDNYLCLINIAAMSFDISAKYEQFNRIYKIIEMNIFTPIKCQFVALLVIPCVL